MVKVFTDSDERVLKEMVAIVRGRNLSSLLRGSEQFWQESEGGSPETYVAKPDAQIAALSGTTPGKGTGNIYRVESDDTLAQMTGHSETVYNLSTTAIPTTDYIPVWRDNFGKWLATKPPGSTTGTVINYVRAPSFFAPGSGMNFDVYTWNGTDWVDGGNNQFAYDDRFACCLLAGEENLIAQVDTARWQPFPKGLLRWAIVDAAGGIDVNATGTVNMIDFSGATCGGTEKTTGHAVTVCNGSAATNGPRKVFNDERVLIHYDALYREAGVWNIVQVPRIPILGQPNSSGDTGTGLFTHKVMKWAAGAFSQWGTNTVSANNQTGMALSTSAIYQIVWFAESDQPLVLPWQVTACQ